MYKLLEEGEIIETGDEFYSLITKSWTMCMLGLLGCKVKSVPVRRKISELVEGQKSSTDKPSTKCYRSTCDSNLNSECNFANVQCAIRECTSHIG